MTEVQDRPHLEISEILGLISEIARDTEHPQRLQALKLLAGSSAAASVLPAPLNKDEVEARLTRLMQAYPADMSRRAFRKAHPHVFLQIDQGPAVPEDPDDLPQELRDIAAKCNSLKKLYKNIPEMKQPGFPNGYPVGRSPQLQSQWCKKTAMKWFADRHRLGLIKDDPKDGAETG